MSLETVTPPRTRAFLDSNPCSGERRTGTKRFWTGREEKLLRLHYAAGGLPACIEPLPGRTATAIYQRARTLGVAAPSTLAGESPRQRYAKSEAIDDVIRRLYPGATSKGDVQRLAETVNRPSWWVSKRAAAMGLTMCRFRALPWTAEGDQILREHSRLGLRALWRKLQKVGAGRTEAAIGVRLKRMRLSRAPDTEDFTARGLGEVMGVDAKTVLRWIEKGWLRGKEYPGGWRLKPRDVRAFIMENAAAIDIRKVEKEWFIDLLAGGAR